MPRKEVKGKMKKKGFTLIELMVVVIILGILAVVIAPRIPALVRKAKEGAAKGALATLRSALNIYYSDNEGIYPRDQNIESGAPQPTNVLGSLVPKYLKKIPPITLPPWHVEPSTATYGYKTTPNAASIVNDATHRWGYCADSTQESDWGNIFINCSHTDTAGKAWCTY